MVDEQKLDRLRDIKVSMPAIRVRVAKGWFSRGPRLAMRRHDMFFILLAALSWGISTRATQLLDKNLAYRSPFVGYDEVSMHQPFHGLSSPTYD